MYQKNDDDDDDDWRVVLEAPRTGDRALSTPRI